MLRISLALAALFVLAGCQSGPAVNPGCDACDLIGESGLDGPGDDTSGGLKQAQAPTQGGTRTRLEPKTNAGSGGMVTADQEETNEKQSTGGNQTQGLLNYMPTEGASSSGKGSLSPAEISIAQAIECVLAKKRDTAPGTPAYDALVLEQQDLLRDLMTASAGNKSETTNFFFLQGANGQITGLSKSSSDDNGGLTHSTEEAEEARALMVSAVAKMLSAQELFGAEGTVEPALPLLKEALRGLAADLVDPSTDPESAETPESPDEGPEDPLEPPPAEEDG